MLRGRPCKQGLYLTRCSVFKDQILSRSRFNILSQQQLLYIIIFQQILQELFLKVFFFKSALLISRPLEDRVYMAGIIL
ncbi:hypothetical protein J23TS9_58650 [Paenibacillus sp. J23TS9]|nr:hypothetical protein J23TS9_58650 [Paenibacillus sp. J23TS9]